LVSESSSARHVLNNWALNGILTLQTGTPYSIIDVVGNQIIQRANLKPGFTGSIETSGSTQDRLNGFFDVNAFAPSRPFLLNGNSTGTPSNPTFDPNNPFGNTARNFLYGPGQKNMDFSVVKFIPITERVRGEFRTEFFNIFNWANFANPNNNIAVPSTFGRITATSAGPRVIQFAFKVNF
jgi:hypothetical protein